VLLGSRGSLLNAPTTIRWDFSQPVTGYSFNNVVTMDKTLLPLLYDMLFSEFDRYVRRRPVTAPPVIFIVDEFGYLSVTPEFETAVAMNVKAYRNFRAFVWVADQDAVTFFGVNGQGSRDEQRIAGNTFIKLFFRQEGQGANVIGAAYPEQLAPEHVQAIKTAPQGELIALFGDDVHPLNFHTSGLEKRYFFVQPPAKAPHPAG
jgi:hypothetical protein